MSFISPEFHGPHQPNPREKVEPQHPRKEAQWERYSIGFGVGALLIVGMVAGGGWGLLGALFTFLFCIPAAVVLTVIFVCMLFRGTLGEAGPTAIILWTAIAVYGWFALIVWIGQSAWGWHVF